jgi:hypothetical protein
VSIVPFVIVLAAQVPFGVEVHMLSQFAAVKVPLISSRIHELPLHRYFCCQIQFGVK